MDGYTPELQQQVRCNIIWIYIWTSENRKWRVLPIRSTIELSSMGNQIQLWNILYSRRRDGTRKTRRSELPPKITWRSTWGHVRNPNNIFHHGKHPTCGWYLWQHNGPQTRFNKPIINNILMETGRTYFLSVRRLPLNWLQHVVGTCIWT